MKVKVDSAEPAPPAGYPTGLDSVGATSHLDLLGDQRARTTTDDPVLGRPNNLTRALGVSSEALRHFSMLPNWIRFECELDPRLRELAIIQIGYLSAGTYEFSHHVGIGLRFGLTETDIANLIAANEGRAHGLNQLEAWLDRLNRARKVSRGQISTDRTTRSGVSASCRRQVVAADVDRRSDEAICAHRAVFAKRPTTVREWSE